MKAAERPAVADGGAIQCNREIVHIGSPNLALLIPPLEVVHRDLQRSRTRPLRNIHGQGRFASQKFVLDAGSDASLQILIANDFVSESVAMETPARDRFADVRGLLAIREPACKSDPVFFGGGGDRRSRATPN